MSQQSLTVLLKKILLLDQEEETIRSEAKKVREEIAEGNEMIPKIESTANEIKGSVIDAKKHVDRQELNATELNDRLKSKLEKKDAVKNQKEYLAIEKEIQAISEQQSELDEVLIKAWHNLEECQEKEKNEVPKLEEDIRRIKSEISEKEISVTSFEEKLNEVDKKKKEHEEQIPQEWIAKYQRMKKKVANPIVPVISKSCSSCYYSVPPQDMNSLKRNAILPCRSCYRLLYYDKEEESDVKSESF